MNEIEKKKIDTAAENAIETVRNDARELNRLALIASSAAASVKARTDTLSNQKFLKRLWNNLIGKNRKLQYQINYDNSKALYLSQQILIKLSQQQTMNIGIIRMINLKLNDAIIDTNEEINSVNREILHIYEILKNNIMNDISDMKHDISLLQWMNVLDIDEKIKKMNNSEKTVKLVTDFYRIKGGRYNNIDLLQLKKALKTVGLENITYREFIHDIQANENITQKLKLNKYTDYMLTPNSFGLCYGADKLSEYFMINSDSEINIFDFAVMLLSEIEEVEYSEKILQTEKALPQMIKAAQQGDDKAQYYIARLCIDGNLNGYKIEPNPEEGYKLLMQSVKNGNKAAKRFLEELTNNG